MNWGNAVEIGLGVYLAFILIEVSIKAKDQVVWWWKERKQKRRSRSDR